MRKKVSIAKALRTFRDYGFTVEFMSDEQFISDVYNQQWEFKTDEAYFTSQDFIY